MSKEAYGHTLLRFEFKLAAGFKNEASMRSLLGGRCVLDGSGIRVINNDGYNAAHPNNPPNHCRVHSSPEHSVGAKTCLLRATNTAELRGD